MNLRDLSSIVNKGLSNMDQQLILARKSMGMRPNLHAARTHVQNADMALRLASKAIIEAQDKGILQPPDVIERVYRVRDELQEIATEIAAYTHLVSRAEARSSQTVAN